MTKSTGVRDAQRSETLIQTFERRLKEVDMPQPGACWLWPGSHTLVGYGVFHYRGRSHYAHRAAYEWRYGPIPPDLCVCHACDTPACVNPAHLWVGTNVDNHADKVRKGRGRCGPPMHGRKHPLAKLDEDKVRYIRSSPTTVKRLARELGVAYSLVHRVRRRESWAHVA